MTERSTYATAALGPGGVYPNRTENGTYALALANLSASTFLLRAIPVGAQVDDLCGTLTYSDLGAKGVTGPTPVSQCW